MPIPSIFYLFGWATGPAAPPSPAFVAGASATFAAVAGSGAQRVAVAGASAGIAVVAGSTSTDGSV